MLPPNSNDTIRFVEKSAPVDTSGPLPLTTSTLAYIPAEHQQKYMRAMDGSFKLGYINIDNAAECSAYTSVIAEGKLRVFPSGETPATQEERARQAVKLEAQILKMADDLCAKEREEKRKATEKQRKAIEEAAHRFHGY